MESTINDLNSFVIQEKLDQCKTSERLIIDNLKNVIKFSPSRTNSRSNSNMNTPLVNKSTTVNSPINDTTSLKSYQFRRHIGLKEWTLLLNLINLTEPDLEILHSIFLLKQRQSVLSAKSFWELVRFFRGVENNLYADTLAIDLISNSKIISPSRRVVTQSNTFFTMSNVSTPSIASINRLIDADNLTLFRSLNGTVSPSSTSIAPSISTTNQTRSSPPPDTLFNSKNSQDLNMDPKVFSLRSSSVFSSFVTSASTENVQTELNPSTTIIDLHSPFNHIKPFSPLSSRVSSRVPYEFTKYMDENCKFGQRVFEVLDVFKIGSFNFLEFSLVFLILNLPFILGNCIILQSFFICYSTSICF